MKHLGDITKINGSEIEPVDCIIGGSPCQDLSVAGKRAGLAGERSGLFMEQIRIVKEMREHDRRIKMADDDFRLRPRYMVWENVPGAFSSNKGKDFQAVLTEIVRIVRPDAPDVPLPDRGGWSKSGCIMGYGSTGCPFSIAWRLHDAQFWGVPQRRKRIALVADFGGMCAPEVLFERKGLSRDSEQGEQARQGAAEEVGNGTKSAIEDVNAAYGIDHAITTGGNCTAQGPCIYKELEGTLKSAGPHSVFCLNDQGGSVMSVSKDVTGALRAEEHGHQPAVVPDVAHTLKAKANCDFREDSETYPIQNGVVRRLTPLECERLQGYPDGWTDIGDWVDSNGKKHKAADSPRYKALGNSIALPFWFYLLRRISAQYERPATLGSLFDGIGGFPLCWERCNGSGTAIWASEIEEFPIAVTKKHFPEE